VAGCAYSIAGIGESAHVVVLHPRGTTRSGGLSRGWWTDADDVVALLDALHLPAASVLAHSAGTRSRPRLARRLRALPLGRTAHRVPRRHHGMAGPRL